jgi:hypothetical protein
MPNNFKKTKYKILKQCISKELCEFVYTHLLLKKNVCDVLFEKKQLPYWEIEWGHYRDPQVPNTYSIYGDTVMEQLLIRMKPLVEKTIGKKLIENYSFARVYKKYDVLKKHIDRYSCEFSTTLNLGGDPWPIYLMSGKKEIKVELNPGDMLVYRGCELQHWRDAFLGKVCGQVFLHYNSADDDNKWDGRPCIGYPFPSKINKKPKQ